MNLDARKSILEMCNGAFQERADYEMSRLIENIMDANTSPTAKRKLTITLELQPDDSRQNISVKCNVKSQLAATNPVVTMLYAASEDQVVEMVPQIPGQVAFDGTEQEGPAILRIVG